MNIGPSITMHFVGLKRRRDSRQSIILGGELPWKFKGGTVLRTAPLPDVLRRLRPLGLQLGKRGGKGPIDRGLGQVRERVGEGFHRDAKGHRDYCCSILAGRNKRLDFGFCHLTATDREQFGKATQRRELRIAHGRSCASRRWA